MTTSTPLNITNPTAATRPAATSSTQTAEPRHSRASSSAGSTGSILSGPPMLNPAGAARALGVSAAELLALVNVGRLDAYRFGPAIRFTPADVVQLRAQLETATGAVA